MKKNYEEKFTLDQWEDFIGHVAEMRRALIDALEGMHPEEIRAMTGLPIERCKEIYRLVSNL